jgi:hypothetical protein
MPPVLSIEKARAHAAPVGGNEDAFSTPYPNRPNNAGTGLPAAMLAAAAP